MSEPVDNAEGKKVRSLTDAMRRVRTAEAERSDVVVELRDAEKARLDLLADELKSVFADVPEDNDTFLFNVAPGTPPRLWIDMTAFVAMGRDRRTYRFLKDSRIGRTIILESADVSDMADCITDYVAERIIERERAMEGDWVLKRIKRDKAGDAEAPNKLASATASLAGNPNTGWIVAAFLAGILIGAVVLFGWAWMRVS